MNDSVPPWLIDRHHPADSVDLLAGGLQQQRDGRYWRPMVSPRVGEAHRGRIDVLGEHLVAQLELFQILHLCPHSA